MRQAGRSLPEYREARRGTGMIESCLIPELAAEITLQPVRRHRVDAAIFFSDIMVPLALAGVGVEIAAGVGPVIAEPVRTASDVDRLVAHRLGDTAMITEAIRLITAELATTPSGEAAWTPLIGFAGAPFTLAAYLVEGRPSRDHLAARAMMHADPAAWEKLMAWCADISGAFLTIQVDAGASAVQLFDSWAGSLTAEDYTTHVAPWSRRALASVEGRVPRHALRHRHRPPPRRARGGRGRRRHRLPHPAGRGGGPLARRPAAGQHRPRPAARRLGALEAHALDVLARGAPPPGTW